MVCDGEDDVLLRLVGKREGVGVAAVRGSHRGRFQGRGLVGGKPLRVSRGVGRAESARDVRRATPLGLESGHEHACDAGVGVPLFGARRGQRGLVAGGGGTASV